MVREGLIAAALTGLMILVFLGSWRSTLIITVSIPLAVLSSLTALSVLGQTINVMTLGGLALAVGILVDDATVTIENVNRHMEELGEDILTAITHGAQEIMPPATVALFCICIAFMPLLALGGVAGYLFRPLAMAVVFAMIASYILTYTLVPTLAHFLLRNQHHHSIRAGEADPPGTGFFTHFQHVSKAVRSVAPRLYGPAWPGAAASLLVRRRLHRFALLSLALAPSLGQDFFPSVDSGGHPHSHARADRHAHRRHHCAGGPGGTDDPRHHSAEPPRRASSTTSACRSAASTSPTGIPARSASSTATSCVTLNEGPTPTEAYVKTLRERLPKAFPGDDLLVPAGRHRQPDPQFRLAGADRRADRRLRSRRQPRFRQQTARQDPPRSRRRGSAHPAGVQVPRLKVDFNRELAGVVGLMEVDASTSMQATLSGSTQTAPTYWLSPANGVSYPVSVQTPQYSIDTLGDLKNLPLTAAQSTQLLGGLATFSPEPLDAVVAHYDIRNTVNIYATTQGRDLGGVAADIQKIVDEMRAELPRGSTVAIRGQVATMASAYQQLLIGLAFSIVLIYLLIVVNFQSWLDPFVIIMALPAALAGIVWMLFVTHTTLSVPALTGAIMCMGVATANSILVVSFAREQLAEPARTP